MKQSFNQSKKTYLIKIRTSMYAPKVEHIVRSTVVLPLERWEGGEELPKLISNLVTLLGWDFKLVDSSGYLDISLPDVSTVLPDQLV